MRNYYLTKLSLILTLFFSNCLKAQNLEWRLYSVNFNNSDPDGAGPATGSVNFTLQIHTAGGIVNNITQISTGFSYQSTYATVPASPGCAIVSNPANVTLSAAFLAAGFSYTTVNQCNTINLTTGGQNF